MGDRNFQYYVISHTHWDREWYEPFERFRIRLVRLMDNLLEILKKYPDYVFHLDAQTALIDDYLEIKPQNLELLKKYISTGRILIGPWFIQNDFFLTSGESTIRNLLLGTARAEELGHCEYVGYTPDQFGLPSQLPQIFNGFGINSCIFGRGRICNAENGDKAEFLWRSNDGSEVLAILMPHWYNNAQRFSEAPEKAEALLKKNKDDLKAITSTRHLLLMNGVDHLEAQENLLDILPALNTTLAQNEHISQSTLSDYCKAVRQDIKNPEIYNGELRQGGDHLILQGTLSSRTYLKIQNVKAEKALAARLEPLCAMLLMTGFRTSAYDKEFLDHLWKLLIINHPHDSICGCSSDNVHRHMEDRYLRFFESLNHLLFEKQKLIAEHIVDKISRANDYYIMVFNTATHARNDIIYADIDLKHDEDIKAFKLLSPGGQEVPYEIIHEKLTERAIRSPVNLPGKMLVDRYQIQFKADVPAFGYTRYLARAVEKIKQSSCTMNFENDYLKVDVLENGQINLYDKISQREYDNILQLEDIADCGDSYSQHPDEQAPVISTAGIVPQIKYVRNNSLETICELKYNIELPAYYDREQKCRSVETVNNKIVINLHLTTESKYLEVSFEIVNKAKDHSLRALINTGIDSPLSYASSPLDVIKRNKYGDDVVERSDLQEPTSDFVHIRDDLGGISILHEGLHAYEHLKEAKGKIAMVLLRSTGYIAGYFSTPMDEDWIVPENQCQRTIKARLAIMPVSTEQQMQFSAYAAADFLNPLFTFSGSCNLKKFSGGRPCVQDSDISEIFFRKLPEESLELPAANSLFRIENKNILLIACKKAEKSDNLIIRLLNIADTAQTCTIDFGFPVKRVWETNLKEDNIQKLSIVDSIKISFAPKQLITVSVEKKKALPTNRIAHCS